MSKVYIVFAFYAQGKLIGYRQDTVGTIGKHAKIYTYSPSQVATVMENIQHNVKNGSGIGVALKKAYGDSSQIGLLVDSEKEVHDKLQEARAFEVRVESCPGYRQEFNVEKAEWVTGWPPEIHEDMAAWLESDNHEVIETHYFSMEGKLNLQ